MVSGLDSQKLGLVFQSRPDILEGIKTAADSPSRVKLFNNIASFVYDQLQSGPEPAAKRRRVDEGPSNGVSQGANGAASSIGNAAQEEVLLEIKDVSVSAPQRKKYDLCFTKDYLYARLPKTTEPVSGIIYAWSNIEYVFCLPVPEKAQVQHNYILFPKGACLAPLKSGTQNGEPLVFTIPATAPIQGAVGGSKAGSADSVSDSYRTLVDWALKTHLRAAGNGGVGITSGDPNKFHSVQRQPQRPNEKALHVKAFRGSKDGFLFFLENGILWGFKKPLMFIPLASVAAVSYTNVLRTTFNVVVEVFLPGGGDDETEEMEFGMLDQADYPGISDSYVKRHGLQDRSMADKRKAKLELAENLKAAAKKASAEGEDELAGDGTTAAGAGAAAGGAAGGMSELEKASMEVEQRLQDEEDEEEEDYDPGSDGDSDGSGSSDEEDDDDEEAGGDEEEEEEEAEDGEEAAEEDGEEGVGGDAEEEVPAEEEEEEEDRTDEIKSSGLPPANRPLHDITDPHFGGRRDNDMDLDEEFDVVG